MLGLYLSAERCSAEQCSAVCYMSTSRPIGAQIVGKLLVTPSGTYTLMSSCYNMSMSIDWKEVEIGKPSTEKRSVVFKAMFKCVDYNSLG